MTRLSLDKNGQPIVTERQMQVWLEKACKVTGWKYYHTWNSMHSAGGFPDYVLVNPKTRRLKIVELKTESGKLTEKQLGWLDDLGAAGVDVQVLRPSGFDDFFEELRTE